MDWVVVVDGYYDVFFIGIDVGMVLKVILVFKGSRFSVEGLFLEELYVFEDLVVVISM